MIESQPKKRKPYKPLKAKQVVSELLQNKDYTEIAKTHFPDANYPSQTVYNALKQPAYVAEIKKQSEILESKGIKLAEKVRNKVVQLLEAKDKDGNEDNTIQLGAANLGAKIEGLIVNKSLNININRDKLLNKSKSYESMSDDELQDTLLNSIQYAEFSDITEESTM